MSEYGMPYMGSKSKVAASLALNFPKATHFYDLFGGGGAITHYMALRKKKNYRYFHYNEIKSDVAYLFQEAISGKYSYKTFKQDWINRTNEEAEKIKMEKKTESEIRNELDDLSAEGDLIIDEDTEKLLDSPEKEETSNNIIEAPHYEIILKDDKEWTIEQIRPLPTTSEAPATSEEPEIVILEEKIVKRYETVTEKVKKKFREKLANSKLKLDVGKKIIGTLWRRPISKSLGSCAAVTFTAPVPNSGSTSSSAMIGTIRFT